MIRIIGNGGHAQVVRDVLRCSFGKAQETEKEYFFVAVGDNRARKKEAEAAKGDPIWALVHPRAYVARDVKLGAGSVIMAGAIIQPGAFIGRHVIVNTCASVDHGCTLEDYVHIAPGAHLCGGVRVGEGSLVGVCVGIAPLAIIPAWSLVKARRLEIEPLPSH